MSGQLCYRRNFWITFLHSVWGSVWNSVETLPWPWLLLHLKWGKNIIFSPAFKLRMEFSSDSEGGPKNGASWWTNRRRKKNHWSLHGFYRKWKGYDSYTVYDEPLTVWNLETKSFRQIYILWPSGLFQSNTTVCSWKQNSVSKKQFLTKIIFYFEPYFSMEPIFEWNHI